MKKWLLKWKHLLVGATLAILLFAVQRVLSPGFWRADHSAPGITCKTNLKNLAAALEMYAGDHRGSYPSSLTQLVPNYLSKIPECPSPDSEGYHAEIGPNAAGNFDGLDHYYSIHCSGAGHPGSPNNYPRYDSIRALVEQ